MSGVNTPGDIDEDTKEENSNESIINCVSQKFQFKAKKLLQRFYDFGDVTRDDRGKITIDVSVVKGGNIVDLINDTVRNSKQALSNSYGQFGYKYYIL